MRVGLSQTARMEQRLVQSPQMIQAMQILQLSAAELEQKIEQELVENPFLEVDERPEGEEGADAQEEAEIAGMIETLERLERDRPPPRTRGPSEEGDKKLEAMQNTPATYHSLGDALLEGIALTDLDPREREIAEYLAYSFDARGYLGDPLEEVARDSGIPDATAEEFAGVLAKLRRATHPALGARDLKECLLLQIDAGSLSELETPLVRSLVEHHLEDITANRLPRIARATGHTVDEVKEAIESIRTLDPVPGREYGTAPAETIHPDIVVEEVEGRFEVRLTREGIPQLMISSIYRRMLQEAKRGDAVRKWIKQRLESARWFIDAVTQRQNTLERIARTIFVRQQDFLRRGVKGLQPLRMIEVADATGVHISTVSRAVAGKYAQTPYGIFPLRFFFSGGTAQASGGMASQASIQQRIKELVEKEDPHEPLSDDRLAELLKEREGIAIARRTITKYRKALGLPSSSQRRAF
jgi:RNA polymerase sigma-54 factor